MRCSQVNAFTGIMDSIRSDQEEIKQLQQVNQNSGVLGFRQETPTTEYTLKTQGQNPPLGIWADITYLPDFDITYILKTAIRITDEYGGVASLDLSSIGDGPELSLEVRTSSGQSAGTVNVGMAGRELSPALGVDYRYVIRYTATSSATIGIKIYGVATQPGSMQLKITELYQ